MSISWNPWHGCHKYSEGCLNCYVYRIDERYDKSSSKITRNASFDLPIRKGRGGNGYKIPSGETVYTCFSSDFLVEEADAWRPLAWNMMRERRNLSFVFITKRITRLHKLLPPDWGDGYDNVTIGCTCENQKRADERLPIFLSLPIKHRFVICEPLLEPVDLSRYLCDGIDFVSVGGESGENARVCDYDWILGIRDACIMANVSFVFRQTGTSFRKNGKLYHIERKDHFSQAKRASIDYAARKAPQYYPNDGDEDIE